MDWLKQVHGGQPPTALPPFGPGDEVRVWYRILEQGKERFGQFEGTVIRFRGSGVERSFTVRRVTYGEGVERVFPADAKVISRLEVLRQGKVKRGRLYYLRTVIGKTRIESAERAGTSRETAAKPTESATGTPIPEPAAGSAKSRTAPPA